VERRDLTPKRPTPIDGVIIFYLALTGLLSLALPKPGIIPGLHVLLILAILLLRRQTGPRWTLLRECYSVPLVPLLYMEIDTLSGLAGGRVYDSTVLAWEHALFGEPSPAMWLSERLPWYSLSELLHLCYLSYYLLFFVLAVRLYRRVNKSDFQNYLWLAHPACFVAYLVQVFFPVQGPRPLFPPLAEHLQGPFWRFCHFLCGQGAAGAAAFPSGHVTLATVVALAAHRYDRAASRWLTPLCLGLTISTVYGRFHYAVDAIAGMLVGWCLFEFGPLLFQYLAPQERGESLWADKNRGHER